MNEQWLQYPENNQYEVSTLGRVRSIDRTLPYGNSLRTYRGRILKPWATNAGYLQVTLYSGGVNSRHSVAHLALETHLGPRPKGFEARHLNGDRLDNRIENLRWGSSSENNFDRVRHGTHQLAAKTHCPQGHEYSAVNTRVKRTKTQAGPGLGRNCRACEKLRYERTKLNA